MQTLHNLINEVTNHQMLVRNHARSIRMKLDAITQEVDPERVTFLIDQMKTDVDRILESNGDL